jgi:hypothetical protein
VNEYVIPIESIGMRTEVTCKYKPISSLQYMLAG